MDQIFLGLLKLFGIKGLTKLGVGIVKWTVRLILWAVAAYVLYQVFNNVVGIISAAALGLAYVAFRWWRNRQGSTPEEVGERTIDGKTVPDKLAVAAPVVPLQSAGIYDVLRGLPDYGKTLLKLTPGQFDYIPPAPEPAPASPAQEPREEKRAPKGVSSLTAARVAVMIWLRTVPQRAVWVAVAAAVLVVAGMGAYREMSFRAMKNRVEQTRQNEIDAALRGLETGKAPEEAKAADPPPSQFDAFLNEEKKAPPQAPPPALSPAQAPVRPAGQDDLIKNLDAQMAEAKAHIDAAQRAQAAENNSGRLAWVDTDNGSPVNWYEAKSYCEGAAFGGRHNWRLPTARELVILWNSKKQQAGSGQNFTLRHSFKLTAATPILWSGDTKPGDSEPGETFAAVLFAYSDGGVGSLKVASKDADARALCVSGP